MVVLHERENRLLPTTRLQLNWANRLHICTEILKDLEELWDQKTSKDLAFRKEAAKS